MSSNESTAEAAAVRPWLAAIVGLVSLGVQLLILWQCAGDTIFERLEWFVGGHSLRKESLFAGGLAALVMLHYVRRHPAPYRDAPVSPTRVALQAVAFLPLLVFLLVSGGVGERGDATTVRLVTAALCGAWLASFALLVPRGGPVGPLAAAACFTFLLVGVAVRVSEDVCSLFWNATAPATLWLVERLLAPLAGAPVEQPEPFVIGTRDFKVEVHPACSGYQGIALMSVLLAGYLWWFRGMLRFPRALLLMPVGIALVYLANAARIAAIVLVGIYISPEIAVEGFHSLAGWLGFLVVGLGLIWVTSRMPFFVRPETDIAAVGAAAVEGVAAPGGLLSREGAGASTPGVRHRPSTSACLLPFLALLATTLVTGAFSAHGRLDILYPLRVLAVAGALWALRREYGTPRFDLSPVAVGLGAVVFAIWMVLAPGVVDPDPEAAALLDPASLGPLWGAVWLVVRFCGYVITVPIAEELAFRGFLARRLVGEDVEAVEPGTFTWLSFLGSSLAFGLLHQGNWIPGTIAGLAYAAALYQRRKIGDAIVAHAVTNALLGFYVIATGSWASWG